MSRFGIVVMLGACGASEPPRAEPPTPDVVDDTPEVIAPDCTADELAALTAEATEDATFHVLRCSASLSAATTITKRILIEDSGVRLACNGATIDGRGYPWYSRDADMIEVHARADGEALIRPEDIYLSSCQVMGSVRTYGMCMNGQDCAAQRLDAETPGHTERARAAAPRNVHFDDMHITGNHRIPFYLSPGVTHVSLTSSVIDGTSIKGAVYLDAESGFNTLRYNAFHVDTDSDDSDRSAPVMSIDGSSSNRIIGNYFSGLDEGGIYLYRNCGEDGTVRWNSPTENLIVNNVFYYQQYEGPNPSVFLGSRGPGAAGYCDEDDHIPHGSGASDLDFVTNNVVGQNQIYKNSADDMIKSGYCQGNAPAYCFGINTPNVIELNTGGLDAHVSREAGCYVDGTWLAHGDQVETCACVDGDLVCAGSASR